MAQSIKLGNDTYLDSSGVVVDSSGTTLATIISNANLRGLKITEGSISSGSTVPLPAYNDVGILFVIRRSTTKYVTALMFDNWDGISQFGTADVAQTQASYYVDSLAEVTVSSKTPTLKNVSAYYVQYLYVRVHS